MRILHILSQTQITGAESYVHQLASEQKRLGHEVFYVSDDLFLQKPSGFFPLPVHRAKGIQFFRSRRALKRILVENKIDVIHAHSRASARLAHSARGSMPIGLTTTFHGIHPASWSKRLRNIYGERSVAICEMVKEWCVQQLWMDADTIEVIRNPFVLPVPNTELAAKIQRIVYVSRPTGPKGQRLRDFLKHHAVTLLKNFPEARLEIFGVSSSDLSESLAPEVLDRIQIRGRYNSPEEVYRNTQLVIGGGRVAMEAVLFGVPTLSLGEYKFEGLITPSTLDHHLRTNFGDTGDGFLEYTSEFFQKQLHDVVTLNSADRQLLTKRMSEIVSVEEVARKMIRNYQLTCFKRRHPKNIPVLMYHKVPDQDIDSQHRIFVNKTLFEKHMRWLKEKGFTALSFAEIKEFLELKRKPADFPKRPILLTFDDGYKDNLRNAGPLLKKYGMKATLFLLADKNLKGNSWDAYEGDTSHELMTEDERQQLVHEFPFEIGSHGMNHRRLTEMSLEDVAQEMIDSRLLLEAEFQRPVLAFAYPFGDRTEAITEVCNRVGYEFAVNTDRGGLYVLDNPHSIFRVNIFPEDELTQLRKKTSTWYRRYFRFKKGK